MTVDVDQLLRPWFEVLVAAAGDPPLLDVHTHIGANDPDGMRQTTEELLAGLEAARARALVFAMHEPGGYREANDATLAAAAGAGGRLSALCRVDPRDPGALEEARRCMDAGAVGIKLHPRAERFTMDEPTVRELVALAHERRAIVLVHAGRGIPALGANTVRYSAEFPDARLILAHCAISDLAWLARELDQHPNVFVDTSWWHPSDFMALFALAPPSNIVWASDSPYGQPLASAIMALRCAMQAGLTRDQLHGVMGGQAERLIAGEDRLELGAPPGPGAPQDPLLERVVAHLTAALARAMGGADPTEPLGLARLACGAGDDHPRAAVFAAILGLLDLFEEHVAPPPPGRIFPTAGRFVVTALVLARTPDPPLPPDIGSTRDGASHEHAEQSPLA